MTDSEAREMARGLVRGSIIEDAAAQFVAQVLKEAHDSRIKPMRDRIKELEAKQQETFQMYVDANEARIDAEAKLSESEDLLAKAQGALHQIAGKKDYADDPWGIARTTLAELKGQDDGQAPHAK